MLTDKQLTALNLLVYENKLKKDVAEIVGVGPGTISEWFLSEEFRSEHQKLLQSKLNSIASRALEVMTELMNNAESENVRFSAAKDLMSRNGMDAVSKSEITQKTIVIGVEQDGTEDNPEEGDIQLDISSSSDRL